MPLVCRDLACIQDINAKAPNRLRYLPSASTESSGASLQTLVLLNCLRYLTSTSLHRLLSRLFHRILIADPQSYQIVCDIFRRLVVVEPQPYPLKKKSSLAPSMPEKAHSFVEAQVQNEYHTAADAIGISACVVYLPGNIS